MQNKYSMGDFPFGSQGQLPAAHGEAVCSPEPSTGEAANAAPATVQAPTQQYMLAAKRWLVWTTDKQPFYVNGTPRRGALDTEEDRNSLSTYQEALSAVAGSGGRFVGVGFALGPDGTGGYWQGVDLDAVPQNQLSDLANSAPGYVEVSPSRTGAHATGYGKHFQTLGSNGSGVEAYASGRYFTYTGDTIRDGALTCLAAWVEGPLAERHRRAGPTASAAGTVQVDPKTVTELRSALNAIAADDYHVWVRMGCALKEIPGGRELWLTWSQTSAKWKAVDAKKWETFRSDRTGYQAVFAEAQRQGWVNPTSNAAQIETASSTAFAFKFARRGDTVVHASYLIDPWLPHRTVVGCYGRGEAGKSSWAAQMVARASSVVSTLWITSEEPDDHIRVRHTACGGEDGTLAVNVAVPTKIDPTTKKAVATSFNIYEHLEPAIDAFKRNPEARADRPLAVLVLDAVVALTTWPKGANANDDEGVKKLIAFLLATAERHNLTILILGHLNKKATEHIADAVTGAAAWTNSVRLGYMFKKDPDEEYQGFVRTVKNNTGPHYGAAYHTVPVHTLLVRPDGKGQYLCGVKMEEPVWGELAIREAMGDPDDQYLNRREEKQVKVQAIVGRTLEGIRRNGHTTRDAVEPFLGHKVDRRHWQAADKILAEQHGVQMENLERGKRLYRFADVNQN